MNVITDAEFWEQRYESLQEDDLVYHSNGFDVIGKCHDRYLRASFWGVQLRPGLYLDFDDEDFHTALNWKRNYPDSSKVLISKFYLIANHGVLMPRLQGVPEECQKQSGHNYLWFLPDFQRVLTWRAGHQEKKFTIGLDLDLFRTFATGFDCLTPELQRLIDMEVPPRFHQHVGRNTPVMQVILQQILNCAYQGLTKRMYLEAKTLELLSLQLAQWTESEEQLAHSLSPQADELERLHYAKEILLRDFSDPPSLMELARQAGLNDFKLKRGFRQVFGITVFGCLQAHRMELAKQLLAEENLSIAAIAHQIGYASQSRFCDAFKRQFGKTPSSYRAALR